MPLTWHISSTPPKGNNSLYKFNLKLKKVLKGVGAHVCKGAHVFDYTHGGQNTLVSCLVFSVLFLSNKVSHWTWSYASSKHQQFCLSLHSVRITGLCGHTQLFTSELKIWMLSLLLSKTASIQSTVSGSLNWWPYSLPCSLPTWAQDTAAGFYAKPITESCCRILV